MVFAYFERSFYMSFQNVLVTNFPILILPILISQFTDHSSFMFLAFPLYSELTVLLNGKIFLSDVNMGLWVDQLSLFR